MNYTYFLLEKLTCIINNCFKKKLIQLLTCKLYQHEKLSSLILNKINIFEMIQGENYDIGTL